MGPKKASSSRAAAVATAVDTAVVSEGTVFSKTWTVGRVLGEGACGKVYAASCVHKDKSSINVAYDIVVKVIPLGPGGKGKAAITQQRIANTLNYEKDLYIGALYDFPYRPQTPFRYGFGDDPNLQVRWLIMEKLACDLKELAVSCTQTPSQIAHIGKQLINGMRWMHESRCV